MLENSNRSLTNKIALIVIGILLIIAFSIATSYAWFGRMNIDTNNQSEVLINTPFYQFITSGNNTISFTINESDMTVENANVISYVQSNTSYINITLKTNGTSNVKCVFDVVYEPVTPYIQSDGVAEKGWAEYMLSFGYLLDENTVFSGNTEISGEDEVVLFTGTLDESDNNLNYKVGNIIRHYNVDLPQDNIIGKTFSGNIKVKNVNCFNPNNLDDTAKNIILLYNGGQTLVEGKRLPNYMVSQSNYDGIGLFKTTDDLGSSYYFRGAVVNNWVKFGQEDGKDIWWRIIRINGDGTIRMIYSGTTAPNSLSTARRITGNGTVISVDGIQTFKYYESANNPVYNGFQYIESNLHGYGKCTTSGAASCEVDGNTVYNSIVKQKLELWWDTTNLGTLYSAGQISDSIFCNDRTSYTTKEGTTLATGVAIASYAYHNSYIRNVTNKAPSLLCQNASDKFTVESTNGNGALLYPIGLITADEAVLAGAKYNTQISNYYLYNNVDSWAMTPYSYSNPGRNFGITQSGALAYGNVHGANAMRPVISLASNVQITGSGMYNDPYIVTGLRNN